MEGNSGGRPVLLGKLFLISLMLSQIAARYCRDKYCQDPISEGKVINTFDSEDENFLSVQKGDTVFIISKSENRKLFEVQVSGSRGLVPAKFIKETRPFVQEENLLHIVHDNIEDDNNDDVDSTSNEETRDPDEEMSKNAESKQMQRNKLLQFVQDIEGEINSSASTDKKEGEEQSNTTFSSPYKKSDVEGSVSLVKEDGSVEGVDRSSNNNNEDDLQDEDVGFKGAVTAPHANEQDRMDDEGRFNHDKMPSNEEWMKNPQFLELRERQLEDYMKDHFTRQETTVEIRRLALDLITNDLLAQVNNRENGLYEMLRHSNPQEDTTGGSSKDHHGIEDMKDKEPTSAENLQSLKEDDPLHINDMDGIKSKGDMGKPGERTDIPKTSSVLDQEALSGSSQTQSFYSPHESLSPVQNIVLENDFGVAEERGKSDSVEGDQPKDLKATSPASSTSLWSTMINDGTVSTMEDGSGELEINGLPSANQAEKEVEVRPTPSKGNEDQDNNFSTLQYNLLTSTPSFSNDAVSTHSKEPLVEEQESAKEKVDVVKEEERSIEQTDLRLEGKVIEEKKESGKEEAKKEDQKDAGEYPSSSTESAIADQLSQSSTAATSHEPARQTSDKQDADPRLSTEGQSQDDKTEEKKESGKEEAKKEDQKDAGEYSSSSTESAIADQLSQSSTAATLHEPVRQTSDKQDVDPRLSTEGQSQDDKTTPDEPIAAPSLPNLHPTHYEDRNTNSISPSPTVNLEESTHGVVSDHQPTHGTTTEIEDREREEEEKNREPEEEKGPEEENLSESTNEQLLALCHAHPTLEACARLRGAKISRGSKDMDLQQTKTRPRQTLLYKLHRILLLILRTFNGWIIRIIKLFLSIIRAPFCLLGLSKPFDCVIDGLDQMCSFTVGTITVMVLMYPMIISPTVRFILYMKNRNKAVKMRSDCERSYIERAKISAEYCDKYRGEMKEAKEKLRIERQERELVEHQMTELRDTIDKLKEVLNKEKSLAETNLKDLQAALKEQDDLRTMIEKKEQEIAQADLVVSKHQKEIENQRETTNSLTTRLEEFQVELTLKDNEIENLQNLVGATEREKALMEHLKDELTEDLKNLETRLKDIEKSVAGKEQERELLEDQLETKDTELEVLRGILMTINTEKNLDGETKDSYEAPDDDPDIQAEQLKKERLTKLMDATAAMTQVKSLEEENKVLTEALGDEIEARKSLEADLEKTKRELQEASNNYREFKAKADAGEIKLTTLRDYFHAQEAELHRKLAAQETARIVSERRLDESMADSTSSVQEAGMLRKQLEDLKQEIRAVERSKQDSENKKDMDYHDLYVKTRQCQRDLEEMTRERDYYRKRLLDKEPLKRSPPPQTRKAGSEGHGSPRDSVDGGRAVSPQSQHSGKFSGIAPGGIGVMGAPFRPIPAQGMMGGMPPPVPPMPPMPGGFFPGMMPPGMMPPGMMPLVGMPGTSTPPQAGLVGSPLTAGGSAAMRPPFRQRLSDISSASVPPSSMTQPNAGLQNTNTMSPFNMQTPPTVQQPSQLVRPVPRTSTPGMAFSGSAHGSNSAFQVPGHAGMQQQTLEQRGPRSQFYSPQSGFSPVQNQTHPGLNNTFPGQAAASGDQGKGHNTLV